MLDDFKEFFGSNWDCLLTVCLICVLAFMISGCAITSPIGAQIGAGDKVTADLLATSHNLDAAVRVGALPASDPAPECIHRALLRAGIGQETFVPEIDGVVSIASVVYIRAKQVENQAPISNECKAVLGDIIIRRLSPI